MSKVKILFLGTPKFASVVLQELIKNKIEVVTVITQPDKRVGRRHRMESPITKKVALDNNIKVLQPFKISEAIDEIKSIDFNLMLTAAYGQFIPTELLKYPKLGSFNLHGSLLPKYRGGAPIHHAIMNGESETGVSLMHMEKEMDSGKYISQVKTKILEEDTLTSVYKRLSQMAAKQIIDNLKSIEEKTYVNTKQDESLVSFGYNVKSKEEYVDFNRTTEKVFNHIRGLDAIPGSYGKYETVKIKLFKAFKNHQITNNKAKPGEVVLIDKTGLYVKTKNGVIGIGQLQREGKSKLDINEFINGNTLIKQGGVFNV